MILNVNTKSGKYDIVLEEGSLSNLESYLNLKRKCLIVIDDNIPHIYIDIVKKACKMPYVYVIKHGESSKNIKNFEDILSFMVKNEFVRSDCVIALGGGVVGDLAGFASSVYMRGIDFYNIPTTLLSQVDSSIGGKTAIDYENVKNIVGSFYQPKRVVIDPNTLKTLDIRQIHAGLAESIKMASCFDTKLFNLIEDSKDLKTDINEIIYRSLLIKKEVVEKDEKESNLRKSLNFGHTFGHAIEESKNYELLHGECVGIGMLAFCDQFVKERIIAVLDKYNLPKTIDVPFDYLLSLIKHDKKIKGDKISIVYLHEIGKFEILDININELEKYYNQTYK